MVRRSQSFKMCVLAVPAYGVGMLLLCMPTKRRNQMKEDALRLATAMARVMQDVRDPAAVFDRAG